MIAYANLKELIRERNTKPCDPTFCEVLMGSTGAYLSGDWSNRCCSHAHKPLPLKNVPTASLHLTAVVPTVHQTIYGR